MMTRIHLFVLISAMCGYFVGIIIAAPVFASFDTSRSLYIALCVGVGLAFSLLYGYVATLELKGEEDVGNKRRHECDDISSRA